MATLVSGFVAPGFEPVRRRFTENFERDDAYREVGASFAVYHDGELVVDLHGGFRDQNGATAWTPDTLANLWSTTKGVTAICIAVLADRGEIDYASPVVRYWPEFAAGGKGEITVSQLLSHQAGLPGFDEPTTVEDLYDWNLVTSRLARQTPMWTPGRRASYHAVTFGFLAGELIRRVAGKSVGRFLAEEVAGPLGADIAIGLPEREDERVAPMLAPRINAPFEPGLMSPEARAAVTNPDMTPTLPNNRAWRAAELPALNAHGTARGLAKIYGALANRGELGGMQVISEDGIGDLETVQTTAVDGLLGVAPYWHNGVIGNETRIYGPSPSMFGHSGWGGSFGCADPKRGIAIGYVMNQMGDGIVGDLRATALCGTVYDCLAGFPHQGAQQR